MNSIGALIVNKQDGLLFWRSTRYANETILYKGEFTGDVASLSFAQSREATCAVIKAYVW